MPYLKVNFQLLVTKSSYEFFKLCDMNKIPKVFLPEQRRAVLKRILAVSAASMLPAIPVRAQSARPWVIAQIVDTTAQQQDVSKDYLIGSRAAWQEINAKGGLQGRPVKHLSIDTDGSAASLKAALDSAT